MGDCLIIKYFPLLPVSAKRAKAKWTSESNDEDGLQWYEKPKPCLNKFAFYAIITKIQP